VEDVTETDWNYFQESWTRYKRSTGLEGQSVMDQLWACASQSLAKACYESGATALTTGEELLGMMKKLSIKAQNKLVNVVQFLSIENSLKLSHYYPDLSNYWTLRTERDLII